MDLFSMWLISSPVSCIGYNSLFTIKVDGQGIMNGEGFPEGQRVWCWIVLCNDGDRARWMVALFRQILTLIYRDCHIYPGKPIPGAS
jgi:hypothetical protein